MPAGRPTKYSKELAAEICSQLADGISLRTICLAEDMPNKSSVFLWLREHEEFSDQYAKAKEESSDALFEELLDIADDGTNDWMENKGKDGECIGYKVNGEAIQRSRLRVDVRKWALSKLKPKKYGEKHTIEHQGKVDYSDISEEELDRRIQQLRQDEQQSSED